MIRRTLISLLSLFLLSFPAIAGPGEMVRLACEDARKLGAESILWRYLDCSYGPPDFDKTLQGVLDFQANSMSREPNLYRLVKVSPGLFRVMPSAYGGQFARQWEKLGEIDPYFHVDAVEVVTEYEEYGYYTGPNKTGWVTTRKVPKKGTKKVRRLSPIPDEKSMLELYTLTGGSDAPIVRGDWWFRLTAIQQIGKDHGYYQFLGLKSRKDYEKLISLDEKLARENFRVLRAAVEAGGVGVHNRQIEWENTINGGHWYTLDPKENTGDRNALKNLNPKDYRHDAEEHYGFLPNGLFALYLSNDKGEQQNEAPGFIACVAKTRPKPLGNDTQVHIPFGCVTCHIEGIRPIDDWVRDTYQSPLSLSVTDKKLFDELYRLYFRPLKSAIKRDQEQYAESVKDLTGWTPEELANHYDAFLRWYHVGSVDVVQAARELGTTKERLIAALEYRLKAVGTLGPMTDLNGRPSLLAAYLRGRPLLRDHFEEEYQTAWYLLSQYPGKN